MAFCTECGANAPEEVRFCIECGHPMNGEPQGGAPVTVQQPAPAMAAAATQPVARPQASTQPAHAQPPNQGTYDGDAPPPKGSKYAVMSTGSYIGHSLLFAIPVVGWLVCLVMAFAVENLNKRHFARAILIFMLIGIVLSAVLYFVFGWIMEAAAEYLNEATQGAVESSGSLFDILNDAGMTGM